MRELIPTSRTTEAFIEHHDYKQARLNVVHTLGLNPIQAELWLDAATDTLLQYYVTGKGHPTSHEGYQTIQAFIGPHAHTMIKAHAARRIVELTEIITQHPMWGTEK